MTNIQTFIEKLITFKSFENVGSILFLKMLCLLRKMNLLEIFRRNYFLLIATFMFIYIAFNLLDGERGLISYFEKQEVKNELVAKKKVLTYKLKDIEKKIELLSDEIDLDYLETLYRDKFFYGKKNEKIFIVDDYES